MNTAEDVSQKVLTENTKKIKQWMSSDVKRDLILKYKGNKVIGRYMKRGSDQTEFVNNATIVLRKDGKGNFILTGYPTK